MKKAFYFPPYTDIVTGVHESLLSESKFNTGTGNTIIKEKDPPSGEIDAKEFALWEIGYSYAIWEDEEELEEEEE